jgi:hypothetical protein
MGFRDGRHALLGAARQNIIDAKSQGSSALSEPTPPRVLISYSHDDPAHEDRVLDLADRLRHDGVDAMVDQYVQFPPEGWPAWCEAEIHRADFVLMVCTETYLRRVNRGEEPGKGHGVIWEARLIRQHLYDSGSVSGKFVPVLFADGSHDHVPTPVKGGTIYRAELSEGYEELYRLLTNQPRARKPELGKLRRLPERQRQSLGKPATGTVAEDAINQPGQYLYDINPRIESANEASKPFILEVLSENLNIAPPSSPNEITNDLIHLLEKLPSRTPALAAAFYAAVQSVDPVPPRPDRPRNMVDILADLCPGQDAPPPLVTFVIELSKRLSESAIGKGLSTWLIKAGIESPLPSSSSSDAPRGIAHGVIEICRGPQSGFIGRAWLCTEHAQRSLGGEETANHLILERWVSQIVLEFVRQSYDAEQDLILEFLLSEDLLLAREVQIERFRLDPKRKDSQPLGTVYPVVLRSHWRAVDDMALHFRSNWRRWSQMAASRGCVPVHWVSRADRHASLFAQLAAWARDSEDGASDSGAPMSVALTFVPKGERGLGILRRILEAGAPVILWPSQQFNYPSIEDWMSELSQITEGNLSGLPQRILRHRLETERDPNQRSFARHLSVICDDAERNLDQLVRVGSLHGDLLAHET